MSNSTRILSGDTRVSPVALFQLLESARFSGVVRFESPRGRRIRIVLRAGAIASARGAGLEQVKTSRTRAVVAAAILSSLRERWSFFVDEEPLPRFDAGTIGFAPVTGAFLDALRRLDEHGGQS